MSIAGYSSPAVYICSVYRTGSPFGWSAFVKEKILVIDDEESIRSLITAYLKVEGYQVILAGDGVSGLSSFRQHQPELVILDIMLPGMDGIDLLAHIRRESNAYVIMLTAKTEETDRIVGLSLGADDYVTKPFSPRELVARVKAAFRRLHGNANDLQDEIMVFKHLRIDIGRRQVWVDEDMIHLTSLEFDLLYTLAAHRGLVLSREQLLDRVWGYEYYADQRLVNVHIGNLRKKLGRDDLIATVRGVGYRLEVEAA
jgi:two-component system alkaline phosphatase synthesis response regulator PhoP